MKKGSWFFSVLPELATAKQIESRVHVQLQILEASNAYCIIKFCQETEEKPFLVIHTWERMSDFKICCQKGNVDKDKEIIFPKFVQ